MTHHSKPHTGQKTPSLSKLRKSLRAQRRSLSQQDQLTASHTISQSLMLEPRFRRAKHVGFYWPMDGEVDISFLYQSIKKSWYLPVLSNAVRAWESTRLLFQHIDTNSQTSLNQYGILEPRYNINQLIRPNMLDVVLCPLVGFDREGNRLGMGQGYYDRTFSRRTTTWHRPILIGLAHQLQACDALEPQPWDIPLDIIITDQEVIYCSNRP